MNNKKQNREFTNSLFKSADDGLVSWEEIAISAILHMSDNQVKKMAMDNGLHYVQDYDGVLH